MTVAPQVLVVVAIAHKMHREKGRDLTQSFDKSPTGNLYKAKEQLKTTTKTFGYTTIADRLWTWTVRCIVTTVIQMVWFTSFIGPTLPLTTTDVQSMAVTRKYYLIRDLKVEHVENVDKI